MADSKLQTESVMNGWFSEVNDQWKGQAMSLEIEEKLFDDQSKYQHVQVYKTKTYGTMLVLDGVIQATERDEFSYQEMMAHPVLCCQPDPVDVLVIGGGDGGVLREICRHKGVKNVTICEIDQMVIDTAKKFLPSMAVGYSDPRVTTVCGDGKEFLKDKKESYDVIIVDSSDPVGPASVLFGDEFYELVSQALKPNGAIAAQGENMWLHLPMIKEMMSFCRKKFAAVDYGYLSIPTYPGGQIGFLCCGKDPKMNFREPCREVDSEMAEKLQYYSPAVHRAAFVLPEFARRALS